MTYEEFINKPLDRGMAPGFPIDYRTEDSADLCLTTDAFLDRFIELTDRAAADYRINGITSYKSVSEISSSPLSRFFVEKQASLSREDFKKELLRIFSRQDELLFISNGGNISASLLDYYSIPHYRKNTYFDIVYVFAGGAVYYFEGQKLTLNVGDLLIVPPEVLHGERALDSGSKVLSCAIRRNAFFNLFLSIFSGNAFLQSFFLRILNGEDSIKYMLFPTAGADGSTDTVLDHFFYDLYREQYSNEAYHSKMSDALMNMILVHLLRGYENRLVLPEDAAFSWKPEYSEIYAYIAAHYMSVTLDELALRFHYSNRQLIRIIKECTGSSFHELILAMKMQQAKNLLQETTISIEEISLRCGYESFSSFSRVFSRYYGCTPGAMRKQNS